MTNSQVLFSIAKLSRMLSMSIVTLSEGVWNPDHNNADGSASMVLIADEVRSWLAGVDRKLARTKD